MKEVSTSSLEYKVMEHKGKERRSPHRRRLSRNYHGAPRVYRILLIAALLLYLGDIVTYTLHKLYDKHLRDQPTDFRPLIIAGTPFRPPPSPVRYDNGTQLDDRYVFMRYLGQGKEGKAAVYVDTESGKSVVVKTYFGHGSNILPLELVDVLGDYTLQWPNEIEAGLLIGNTKAGEQQYFVPVVDLFVLQAQDRSWHWALVTPFIEGGTLLDLASHIRSTRRSTAMELDQEFRPVLHGALEALVQLHGKGYCHNDIKTDNLFVLGNNHWLLGDLGQVRQSSHPWHGTKTWRERNQWSDCHLNDVRRLLKSYMTFLREAGADWQAFDQAFSHGEEAWSRLYWSWMALPTPANGTIVLSHQVGPEMWLKEAGTRHNMGMCLKRGVERELKCTSTQLHWYEYLSYWRC